MRQETLEQLNRISENVPGVLYRFIMKKDGTFSCPYISDNVRALGLETGEVTAVAGRMFDLVHPEDLPGMMASIGESARTLSDWRWEGRMVIGGKTAWYRGASRPRRLDNGDILWDGLILDITDQRELQRKMEKAEVDFRNIIERTAEGVYRSTLEGRYIMVNKAFARMFGYDSPKELMESVVDIRRQMYSDPADREGSIRKVLARGHGELEVQVLCRDGSRKWVLNSVRVVRDGAGNVAYFEGIVKDITDRVHAQEQMRLSEERYRLLIENLPVVTYSFSPGYPDGAFFINGKVRELTGYDEEELMETPTLIYDMMHPEDRAELIKGFTEDLRSGSTGERTYRILTRDGMTKWIRDRYYLTRNDEGYLVRVYGLLEDISSKKKIEEELTTIMKSMTDMIAVVDLRGVFQFVTPSSEILAGYRPEELLGRDCMEQVHPDDHAKVMEAFKRTVEGEKAVVNYRVRHRDGHYIWVDYNATLLHDRRGKMTGVVSGHRDVTDRVRAQEALRRSEEKYRLMIENIPLVVYSVNTASPPTEVFMFGRVKEVTGYSTEDFLNDPGLIIAVVHPADRAMVLARSRKSIKDNIPLEMEYRIITRDGRTRWLRDRFVPVLDEHGRVGFVYGIVEDVTQRKTVEEALKESEARFRSIFENAVEGIFQTTPEGNFISANPALTRMAGYASTEEMLRDVKNITGHFYVDLEDRKRHLDLVDKQGFVSGYEVPCKRKDGSVIWVSFSTRAVKRPDGRTAFYEGTIEDITLRKQAERELQACKKDLERQVDRRTAELQEREKELEQKSRYLEEANTALRVLLSQREKDTREVQEAVLNNVRELILPHVEKLKLSAMDGGGQKMYLDIIEKNLETIVSPYITLLKRMNTHLTPQEIQVANMVKQGHSSKTIAGLLNLSMRTVDCHRANIRKKLGIRNKKANLRIRLGALEG